jgi:hypothetical protein
MLCINATPWWQSQHMGIVQVVNQQAHETNKRPNAHMHSVVEKKLHKTATVTVSCHNSPTVATADSAV